MSIQVYYYYPNCMYLFLEVVLGSDSTGIIKGLISCDDNGSTLIGYCVLGSKTTSFKSFNGGLIR